MEKPKLKQLIREKIKNILNEALPISKAKELYLIQKSDKVIQYQDKIFNELKNQAKQSIPEKDYKDFENYIEKYYQNPQLNLVYTKKHNSEKKLYSDIIKDFIKAYQINS